MRLAERIARSRNVGEDGLQACSRDELERAQPVAEAAAQAREQLDRFARRVPVGTEPPPRPVFPPCGTTATPSRAQSAITRATSAVLAGRTTHSAWAEYCRRQSVK